MVIVIKTHSYNVNLNNVLYWRSTKSGTLGFKMVDGTQILTTCPYQRGCVQIDEGIRSLKYHNSGTIYLSYKTKPILVKKKKPVDGIESGTMEEVVHQIVDKMAEQIN